MFSWDNPSWGKNKAYTEVREAEHFTIDSEWELVRGYMNEKGRVYTKKNMGYKTTVCIGQANSSIFEAIISMDTDIVTGSLNAPLDHYEVVFTWAPSFRRVNPGECISGLHEAFYLHGIWPQDANGRTPTSAQRVDPKPAINKLRRQLDAHWPSIIQQRHAQDFWMYEWNTHGRYGRLPPEDYFRLAIAFGSNRSRFKRYLGNAGITPDLTTSRTKAEIENAIRIGRERPNDHDYISAAQDPRKTYLLYQFHICLDAKTNPISCTRPNLPGDCIYPPSPAAAAADDANADVEKLSAA